MKCSVGPSWVAFNLIVLLWGRAAGIETCTGGAAFSVPGPVVQLGTNVTVYCTFKKSIIGCRTAIYQDSNEIRDCRQYNSSTIYLEIANLQKHKVAFACKTECNSFSRLICGIDIKAGYLPDPPQNLTCTQNGQLGDVTCTWDKGREPYIKTIFHLRMNNKTHDLNGICDDPGSGSVSFHTLNAESVYTVWVTSSNALGSASSPPLNITLNDIVKPHPPVITLFNCASSDCTLHWEAAQNCQLLEVRDKPLSHSTWKHHTLNVTVDRFTLPGLQPFTDYQFQVRCKLSHTKGMWSEWSEPFTNRTPEAVPIKELDIWFVMETPDPNSLTLVWKKLSQSEARGQILGYNVTSPFPCEDQIPVDLPDYQNHLTVTISHCILTLSAFNSRGNSPPTNISIPFQTGFPAPGNVTCMRHSNEGIVVKWRPPVNEILGLRGYVVEWSPTQDKLDLGWTRLTHDKLSTVISVMKPYACYKVTVNALYDEGVGKAGFVHAYVKQLAPTEGPTASINHKSSTTVTVHWQHLPVEHRKGCISSYSIYLKSLDSAHLLVHGPIDASHTNYTINGLKPGATYQAWMTASTAAGEGPKREFEFTVTPEENPLVLSLTGATLIFFLVWLALLCICCNSAVNQRMTLLCSRFTPQWYTGHVPDPANCKWAQEYAAVKGQMKLVYDLHLSDSLSSCDEPDTLEVEEVSEDSDSAPEDLVSDNGTGAPAEEKQAGKPTMLPWCRPADLAIYKHQLPCAYIQSVSQESDTSVQTPESCNTEITVDYIPSNVLHMGSSEEETCDFFDDFAPSFLGNLFSKPEGTLTLDAVKIDCSSFLD
ncbi:interleukin-12 receptor subunit beta-2-like isoform X1 [Acipenser ruthenus]|uniref:interleukin-12 receptor subunit beta-2-like isoform X1 n=1 Tax=Acipenser ruthenus TaxID=7906 RepID=UPI0027419265|nr:interleukin-12 receptor subunit beta-2-like isoform X1 [Acipenser ruthenus]